MAEHPSRALCRAAGRGKEEWVQATVCRGGHTAHSGWKPGREQPESEGRTKPSTRRQSVCQARQSSVGCIGKAASIHSWELGWLQAQGDPTMAPRRLPAVFLLWDGAIPGDQLPMDVWLVQRFGFGTQLRPAREGNPEQRVLRASQL